MADELVPRLGGQVLGLERVPHHERRDLGARVLRDVLDRLGELDLHAARQVEPVLGLHDVGHTTLAGLAVDADHRFVRAPDVLGVDRQVRDAPLVVVLGECLEALLDGVLVAPGERRVHEVPDVGVARVDGQAVAVLGDAAQGIDVGDVELRVDAVGEQVHRQRDDVDVAGSLAVAEQGPLDTVGAGHHAELGGGHRTPTIVVRVQRQHDLLAPADRAEEPLDDVAVDVGGVALDRRRQVEDDRPLVLRLDDVHHPFADLDGEVGFRQREALGRVLVPQRRVRGAAPRACGTAGRR